MAVEVRNVQLAGGDVPGLEAAPPGPARGGVVVVQEAFGVDAHIADVCGRLAGEGYLAVAPALFHRSGSPVFEYSDIASAREVMGTLSPGGILADVDAALRHLEAAGQDAASSAIVGFCLGGEVACFVASERAIGASVTFYGGGVATGRFGMPALVDIGAALRTPWLGLFGDQDHSIPVDEVEALRAEVAKAPVEAEIVRYEDAGHAFHNDARHDVYVEAAAKDAWARALAFLAGHLGTGAIAP